VYGELPLQFPPIGSSNDRPVGGLRVTETVHTSTALAEAIAPFALPEGARGRLVKSGHDARLRVRLVPHDAGIAARLATSDLLEMVMHDGDVDVELVQRDGAWVITDDVHGYGETSIVPALVAIGPGSARWWRTRWCISSRRTSTTMSASNATRGRPGTCKTTTRAPPA